ncbi:hypothetical protein GWK48_06300 [Metallosphaera tengchongensis]|uniref:Carbohydrate kinase PfkB domain-containing protein n=1 Tax=Metallosphaera tengchongensis TaxID=1532350 RepID=A0A6N0NY62_9CREN|nr:hypothetical protein [Metallosphaera tengchongensis]QKR00040.1 hypothetical protein GWK48_06300 [Metallosphaera tengchongensis]
MRRTKVIVLGAVTIDEIYERGTLIEKAGGSPIYSGLGVDVTGGEVGAYIGIGKDFVFELPKYLKVVEKSTFEKTMRFTIIFENNERHLILRHKHGTIPLRHSVLQGWQGVLINPVCGEIGNYDLPEMPIAVDIQGFIRNCIEGEEIVLSRPFSFRVNSDISVFHANVDELQASNLDPTKIKDLGYKEIIISDGSNGFTLYASGKIIKRTPIVKGSYEVGNGDFLLASYFTLRLEGLDPEIASSEALNFSEKFSTQGLNLSRH